MIIGSALVVSAKTPPFIFGMSVLGFTGIAISAVMGLWIFLAIIKNGRL